MFKTLHNNYIFIAYILYYYCFYMQMCASTIPTAELNR